MIIRTGTFGAVAAMSATLMLAPALAAAQGIGAFNAGDGLAFFNQSTGSPVLGGIAGSPTLDPQFGPEAQDAPAQSTLTVRAYDPHREYARGFVDLQLGKFREAAGEFNDAMEVSPDKGHSVDMSTLSTHPTNRPDKPAKLDSQFLMKCLYMLGVAKSGEGDLQGALAAFEKAMKVDPLQIAVKREYAVTLARLGETDKAQAQLEALKMLADVCDGACAEANDYKAALARVQAALSGTLSAPG